ncbi:MAG TPA: hypothetical protein VKL19_04540 [Thermoanaerobaculia bacterium]|nr:hypothetical protein [Thermoanaerobaculia bacterium]
MLAMLRRFSIFLFIFSALIAAEPLLHSHPLQQNFVLGACAVCATAIGRLPIVAPSVAAPQTIVYTLAAPGAAVPVATPALSLPSRAPPAL